MLVGNTDAAMQLNVYISVEDSRFIGQMFRRVDVGVQVRPGPADASQPPGPLRVTLNGRSAQHIIASVQAPLTRFQIAEPTLEDAYLVLLERAGAREPDGS